MHSKRRYKICIRSVILGELEAYRAYKGFSIIFPKLFTKVRIILIPLSMKFFNPTILDFIFYEN